MRGIYLDTSVLVAALVHESGTAVVHRYLKQADGRPWLISSWVETEFGSALGMQVRRNVISAGECDAAWHRFQALKDARLQLLELERVDFDVAARMCLLARPPLRAGDALHVALCLKSKSCLVSCDQAMCSAAAHHRVAVDLLTPGTL